MSLTTRGMGIPVLLSIFVCCCALGQTTHPSALSVEQDLEQLQSGDWIMQWQAIEELGEGKVQQAARPLHALFDNAKSPVFLRGRALVALAQIEGEKVLGDAMTFAQSEDPVCRAAGACALGLLGAEQGKDRVAQLLKDKESQVRGQAIIAHARLSKGAAMAVVVENLAQWDTAPEATQALVYVGTDQAWNKLLDLLDAKDVRIRVAALHALAKMQDPRAIGPILARLSTTKEDRAVLAAAKTALASFPPESLHGPLLAAFDGNDPQLYAPSLVILAENPDKETAQRVAEKLDLLKAKAPQALPAAFKLLSRSDADAYAKRFVPFVNHENAEVRRSAIDALGRSQAKGIDLFALLRDRLMDQDKTVRAAAYQALRIAARGVPRGGIVAYLAGPLASDDKAIYYPALELLRERMGRPEIPAALAALDHFLAGGDAETRKLAAQTIETYADAAAMEALARAQGYPSPWLIIGPFTFEPANGADPIETAFPPENQIDLKKSYDAGDGTRATWALLQANRSDGIVDLAFIYAREGQEQSGKTARVAYTAVTINAAADTDGLIALSSRGTTQLWLGGQKLAQGAAPGKDEQRLAIHLARGSNLLVVKCATGERRDWQFRLQLLGKDGRRLGKVTYALPTPP